jgi:aminoglycoside phosphotransferase (APT) family kinase protein
MTKPSNSWAGFSTLDPESDGYKQIQNLLLFADFKYLELRALLTRSVSGVSCNIDASRFTCGFQHVIFEVAFSDNTSWIARVRYIPVEEDTEASTMSEIATMDYVRSRTTIPVAQIFDSHPTSDNPFGYPYMLTEYLPGRPRDNILAFTVPKEFHAKVADQLANIFLELHKLTFDYMGYLWKAPQGGKEIELVRKSGIHTSLEYFYATRVEENRDIVESTHPREIDWLTACWVLKLALTHIIVDERVRGPFPLCHPDLHHGNLLFGEEYNLTGVLDWSNTQTMPMERLAVCPEFITFPGLSDEENRPIIEFKELFIESLRRREDAAVHAEEKQRSFTTLSTFMKSERAEIAYLCTYTNSRRALYDAKRVAKLMFGDAISWELLREVYGDKPL